MKKNGEFTINIALIHQGEPVAGVVYRPVTGAMYSAQQGRGAYLEGPGWGAARAPRERQALQQRAGGHRRRQQAPPQPGGRGFCGRAARRRQAGRVPVGGQFLEAVPRRGRQSHRVPALRSHDGVGHRCRSRRCQ